MGICFSTTKITGFNSTTNSETGNDTTGDATTGENQQQNPTGKNDADANMNNKKEANRNHNQNHNNKIVKGGGRVALLGTPKRQKKVVIPCGKKTDFGYLKDFDKKYSTGKLLGHGQFGYTYVAVAKANGDRVAVKKIDKNKVLFGIQISANC